MSARKFTYKVFETELGQSIFVVSQQYEPNFLNAARLCTKEMGKGWAQYDDFCYVRHGFGKVNGELCNDYFLTDNETSGAFQAWIFSNEPFPAEWS